MKKENKKYSTAIFVIYVILLLWLVLFKLSINIAEMDHFRNINIIPFQGIRNGGIRFKEIFSNILVFIPMGIYLRILWQNWKSYKIVAICFGISFSLEAVQYIFAIGASDITDLIGNTLGGFIGIILYWCIQKIFKSKAATAVNVIATIFIVLCLLLFLVLMVANLS